MPESNVEPGIIQVRRQRKTGKSTEFDLLVHWDIRQESVEEPDGEITQVWRYEEEELTISFDGDTEQVNNYLDVRQRSLLKKAKAKAGKLKETDTDTLSYPTFKADSSYYGRVAEIDTSRPDKKYLRIEKTVAGRTISAWCYVDYSLLLAHQNNDLSLDDLVIVSFVDEDLGKPYVEGKVIY